MEDDSRIAFNKDYVLDNVIKEDLSANEKYTIDNDGDVMFAIESTDGIFSSYMHMLHYLQSGEGLPETVQYITLCETYNANGEFWFGVWKRGENGYPEEVMDGSTTKEEQEAVMEEFLETYNLAINSGFKNINIDLMIDDSNYVYNNMKEEKIDCISKNVLVSRCEVF